MNKEEKLLMERTNRLMEVCERRLTQMADVPVLFQGRCQKCNELTVHVSHIARLSEFALYDTTDAGFRVAIKTCLVCGKSTYRGE